MLTAEPQSHAVPATTEAPLPSTPRGTDALITAQMLGAFNDNAFKLVAALLAIRAIAGTTGIGTDAGASASAEQTATTTAFVAFTLPLMLVSLPAASWVDRWNRRTVLVATKFAEIVLMLLGTLALAMPREALGDYGHLAVLTVLAAMGAQSAVFSPAKYAILPDLVPPERLVRANGKLETMTMLAIIGGTAAAGAMLDLVGSAVWLIGVFLTTLSVIGYLAIRRVPNVEVAARPYGGIVDSIRGGLHELRSARVLCLAALGAVTFWGIATLIGQNVLVYGKSVLALDDTRSTVPLAASGIGIAVGAYMVGRFTRSRMELGWIPLGAIGLGISAAMLGWLRPGFHGTLGWMFALGVSSGHLLVPLNALLQQNAPAERRGAVIALVNAATFGGILAGTLSCDAMARAGFDPAGIFRGAALVTLAGTAWALWLLPRAGVRLVLLLLTHTLYRVRVSNAERVPDQGGVLLVCNHVSFVDGLLLSAAIDRPIRFLVEDSYYQRPWLRPFMRWFGFVPIAESAAPRELLQSIRAAGELLDAGEVVCIFAEGQITRTGQILPFRRGFQRIVKGRDVAVLPVHLDRVWGSLTSFGRRGVGQALASLPRRVVVSFGTPRPTEVSAGELQAAVRELGAIAWRARSAESGPLHRRFVYNVRRAPWRFAAADERHATLSRIGLLSMAIGLARALRSAWGDQRRVGVMLPPSVGGAAMQLAASLSGRTIVHLNYTVGVDSMSSALRQAGLRTLVTSKAFVERANLTLPADIEVIWLEDVGSRCGLGARCAAFALGLFAPQRLLERACGAPTPVRAEDPATVIFSSGSTGEPKGVVLSHFNLRANAEGVEQALRVGSDDRLLGSLPLFHSFGTMGLWFALQSGIGVVFEANPLDAARVGACVERYRATILIATPTFLQLYVRRCTPGQFGSLRLVIVGAEKLPARVADAFEEQFGIRPLEGYGATECAPVIAVNTPGFRAPGFYQSGSRRGTVGQPLPGVALRVVEPDTGAVLPTGASGLLEVLGPNVMCGYLGRDDLTSDVLRDGWYRTGDIAQIDEDGYVTITDRLSRFSKIGGEMVPHGLIESTLQELLDTVEQRVVVTSLPSAKKGERLAVLHTLDDARLIEVHAALATSSLPKLFVPRLDAFVRVAALPVLGTGKLDLRAARRIAAERLGEADD